MEAHVLFAFIDAHRNSSECTAIREELEKIILRELKKINGEKQ